MAKKYSVSQVADIISSEGLGYAIQSYLKSTQIKDEDLAEMWERASDILTEITEYIEENSDSVDDADEPSEDDDESYDNDY